MKGVILALVICIVIIIFVGSKLDFFPFIFWYNCDYYVCRRFGLLMFRFIDVLVCQHFGLPLFQFVDVLVCRRFCLSTFRFVDVLVCRRFGCWGFSLSTFWLVTLGLWSITVPTVVLNIKKKIFWSKKKRKNNRQNLDTFRKNEQRQELFSSWVSCGVSIMITWETTDHYNRTIWLIHIWELCFSHVNMVWTFMWSQLTAGLNM